MRQAPAVIHSLQCADSLSYCPLLQTLNNYTFFALMVLLCNCLLLQTLHSCMLFWVALKLVPSTVKNAEQSCINSVTLNVLQSTVTRKKNNCVFTPYVGQMNSFHTGSIFHHVPITLSSAKHSEKDQIIV